MLGRAADGKKKQRAQIIFEEICYTSKVTPQEISRYLDCLKGRVRAIEETIDHHFIQQVGKAEWLSLKINFHLI